MTRPLLFDITHLTHRLAFAAPSGIDRVDLSFARFLAGADGGVAGAVHYGHGRPRLWPAERLGELVRGIDARWRESLRAEDDARFLETREWILGGRPVRQTAARRTGLLSPRLSADIAMNVHIWRARVNPGPRAPQGAIYLNIAQHAFEHPIYFEWLASRPDIRPVFFLHDLLPLDFPEFWWAGHEPLFQRRVDNLFRHAAALITTSDQVRERALAELRRRASREIPILACPLPSPLETPDVGDARDAAMAEPPYFVVIGTLEPRKNHLLLLNVWRSLAASPGPTPKLVIVGARGWENEQVVDMLERCREIADHVWETTGVSNAGLRRLVANARAVLVPSFAEGFGLPLVEALSLGIPVVASDIPVFHDVAGDCAIFREPIDGPGWREAIVALADAASPLARQARARAAQFRGVGVGSYFSTVKDFLAGL